VIRLSSLRLAKPEARPEAPRELRAMSQDDLDQVCVIEQQAYSFPWTRGNFGDSLEAGHSAWVLEVPCLAVAGEGASKSTSAAGPGELIAYWVGMLGVEEMHLLNITVRPDRQGQGHAQFMMRHLHAEAHRLGAAMIWLEVRQSNSRARRLYEQLGFAAVGLRKNYYPAARGAREDAVVMCCKCAAITAKGPHGLD
jgi:ribosomal-protein-alanine N-acetyltransferase